MSFFNKELSSAHKKEHNWEIDITKKVLAKLKQLLFDKSKPIQRITLVEDNEMISEDKDKPELLNSLFSNAVKNLKIFEIFEIFKSSTCGTKNNFHLQHVTNLLSQNLHIFVWSFKEWNSLQCITWCNSKYFSFFLAVFDP